MQLRKLKNIHMNIIEVSNLENIVLVGFMGCGKTSVGKRLSNLLDMEFVDIDEEIVKYENKTIADIFEERGESYFRDVETLVLSKYVDKDNLIISTGGGIIEREANESLLRRLGKVIWLCCGDEKIISNLKNSSETRPLLLVEDPQKRIQELYSKRRPKYEKASNIKILTDDKNVDEVASNILLNINKI